jgi:hypothetical protein
MRPDEISNNARAKKVRGQKAASQVARRIAKKSAPLAHDEVVALFCVPLDEKDKARRELFQSQLSDFRPSLSFYFDDLAKISAKQIAFLDAFGQSGIVRDACNAARVSRRELSSWLDEDEAFRQAYEDTEEDATDDLELIALERAKSHSDPLMIMMLKAKRPHRYVERSQIELTKANKNGKAKKQVWQIGETTLEF